MKPQKSTRLGAVVTQSLAALFVQIWPPVPKVTQVENTPFVTKPDFKKISRGACMIFSHYNPIE